MILSFISRVSDNCTAEEAQNEQKRITTELTSYLDQGYLILDMRTRIEGDDRIIEYLLKEPNKENVEDKIVCLYKEEQQVQITERIHKDGGKGFFFFSEERSSS